MWRDRLRARVGITLALLPLAVQPLPSSVLGAVWPSPVTETPARFSVLAGSGIESLASFSAPADGRSPPNKDLPSDAGGRGPAWTSANRYRIRLSVDIGSRQRRNSPASVEINFQQSLRERAEGFPKPDPHYKPLHRRGSTSNAGNRIMRPSGTLSPTGGEGRGEGAHGFSSKA